MPSDEYFIGIDSGTQSTKVAVFSHRKGAFVAQADSPHDIIENSRGGREQSPQWWVEACRSALVKALSQADIDRRQVKAIGVSGQQHGFVPLDKKGAVIRPAKLWCDTETASACRRLIEQMGGDRVVFETIGSQISTGFTASKILWLKENEPANYDRLATILLPHDYLNYWLTGQCRTEYGDASGTGFFDVHSRTWSKAVLRSIDDTGRLEACLPDLMQAVEPCGHLRPELAESWGFSKDVLVSAGGGDNMMAAIGTGNVRPGVLTASLGTSGTIYGFSPTPISDPKGELAPFCSSTGGWLPLVCTMNVTVATEQTRALLGLSLSAFNACVAKAPPGAEGLTLLPYFNGERTPDLPQATANLSGINSMNLTPANLARASMEGATFGLRYGLAVMQRNGLQARQIRLVGGGAKSPVWCQMVADIFDLEVVTAAHVEAGALGAALQSLWCYLNQEESNVGIEDLCRKYVTSQDSGRMRPNRNNQRFYDTLFKQYLHTDRVLRPLNQPLDPR